MDSGNNHFKKWFGYDRRERRATSILLLIVVIVFISRYLVPGKPVELRYLSPELSGYELPSSIPFKILPDSLTLFYFDPNVATQEEFMNLGLSAKQSGTIINYRNAGGKFYDPADFAVIYGIDSVKIAELTPFIRIGNTNLYANTSAKQTQTKLIDLNTCDSVMLDLLPGIGPVLSARIIKYRNLLGGFASINQLNEVYGLSPETFALISEKIYTDSLDIKAILINQAVYNVLIRHPYFEPAEVTAILKYKELEGTIYGINELVDNNIITPEKARKILPYLSFD